MGSYGWAGTVLNIDLTSGSVLKEALTANFARKYLGASGFNSIRLFELVGSEVEALSPENVLMVGTGPLCGTLFPGSARITITAKSPVTDIFGDSNMGGFFAAELKFAGYDQIVIRGQASHPVYLWIDDDNVELKDASHLWGKSTWETAKGIQEECKDPDTKVICIGPAGENLVRIANVMSPPRRSAGRSGMGAVMGSKNLKAIAVRGSGEVAIAHPREFIQACHEARDNIASKYHGYKLFHELGTPGILDRSAPAGQLGVRNYQSHVFPNWESLSGRRLKEEFGTSMMSCSACHVACNAHHSVKDGEFAGTYGSGPELALTGSAVKWDIDNLPAILKMNQLFNQYGVDIHGARGIIGWAMECYQRGILTDEDFDGKPLRWGDYHAVIEMIPRIARREGFGRIIAEGDKRAARLLGRGSEKYLYHVKGYSFVPDDPRADKFYGLAALTSTRGGDHLKAATPQMRHFLAETETGKAMASDPEILYARTAKGKGMAIKWFEDAAAVHHACGVCVRTGASLQILTEALSAATGIDFSQNELLEAGERIFNVQKAFNSRLGLTREDDNYSVPEKFTDEPIADGDCAGQVLERDMMLDEYYMTRGWDMPSGLQTRQKLEQLGLGEIADELEKAGDLR